MAGPVDQDDAMFFGEIVAERYRYGRTDGVRFLSFSMAKSVTSMLIGIALSRGIIASLAVIVRKELLVPIICGIFLVENLSVMLQVSYFKYTKKKYGEGRRILLMSPLHHHYPKLGYHESKIVTRFWIVAIMLAILSIVTLKLQ